MRSSAAILAYKRTLDAKPNAESIVKPGELVDIIEMTPLTLCDRRIYNLLVAHAWDEIDQPKKHLIPKRALQSTDHKGTNRLGESINRLMSTIVKVRVQQNGEWVTQKVQLLGSNVEPEGSDGMVRYEFPADLRKIITESTIFARLQRKIMFEISSKYSLALYEMIQKRGNLKNRTFEEISLDDLRGFLGVPKDKLTSWINLKNKALTPAIAEVSERSDFVVEFTPIKGEKKQFTGIRLSWQRKPASELKQIEPNLDFKLASQRARSGAAQSRPSDAPTLALFLRADTMDKAKRICPGYDVYYVEQEWQRWAAMKPNRPDNSDAAFLAFCKQYVARNPL